MSSFNNKHSDSLTSFFIILGLLFVVYPELFLARSAFLIRDHIHQHYPWAVLLSASIKSFRLPFWTSLIHSGFPIAAEGQIGIFYLPNLILYFFFPVQAAYSYLSVVHFFISGWATYLYVRQMQGSVAQALITAFVFLFGAAYGGAYYNITSLLTIAWFPLALLFFERLYEVRKWRYVFFLGVTLSFMLLAGYLQVATLTIFIVILYAGLRIAFFGNPDKYGLEIKVTTLVQLLSALAIACLIALPQLLLTFELALQSSRVELEEGYAYVGSMSPWAIFTLIFPLLQGAFRGNSLYIGMFPLILVFCAVFSKSAREKRIFQIWVILAIISLLLALGQWSPLYTGLIKLTHFYSFRTPAKFIVFISFALAILSGIGFETAWRAKHREATSFSFRRVASTFNGFVLAFGASACLIYVFLTIGREQFMRAGDWFIQKFIYGRPGHPHELSIYHEKLIRYHQYLLSYFSFHDFWVVWSVVIILIGIVFSLALFKMDRIKKVWLSGGLIFLVIDLYGFAWRDIKRDFDTYDHALAKSQTVQHLLAEQAKGKVGRLYGFRPQHQLVPLIPSVNMLYNVEDIGAYSPFVLKRYHESIGLLGSVDDSNLSFAPTSEFLFERLHLLDVLDVSHILSPIVLEHPRLKLLMEDKVEHTYLYENLGTRSKAFFVAQFRVYLNWKQLKEKLMEPYFDPREVILFEAGEFEKIQNQALRQPVGRWKPVRLEREIHGEAFERWNVQVNQPGFFVLTNTMYPGWRAYLNGVEIPVLRAYGLFQAVWLSGAGEYVIEFKYSPFVSFFNKR